MSSAREPQPLPPRSLAEGLADVVVVLDADGCCRFAGAALHALLGLAPAAVVGRPLAELVHPGDRLGGGPCRLRRADGSWCEVEVREAGTADHGDRPGPVLVVRGRGGPPAAEVDEVVGRLPEALLLVEPAPLGPARVTFANAAFLDRFGHREGELVGRPAGTVVLPDPAGGTDPDSLWTPAPTLDAAPVEVVVRAGDGAEVWADLSVAAGPGARLVVTVHDATRRRVAEDRWRQGRDRVRRLAHQSPDAIYRVRVHPEMAIEYLSAAVEQLLGWSPAEITRDPSLLSQALDPDDRRVLLDLAGGGLTGLPDDLVVRWRHRDGRLVWTELRAVTEHDDAGAVVAIEGTARDVTSRKLADLASSERERYARAVLDGIGAETVVIDPHGVITRANHAWIDLVGLFQPGEADGGAGRPYLDIVKGVLGVSGRLGELAAGIADVVAGVRAHLEIDVVSEVRGSRRWYAVRASPLAGMPGGGAVLTHSDISSRKEAEALLAGSEARYRAIIDTVPDVVYQCDTDGRFTFLNRAWEQLTGRSVAESLGTTFWSHLPECEREQGEQRFRAFVRGDLEPEARYRATVGTRADGLRTIEFSPQLFRVDGEVTGTTGTMVDVTDLLQDEVELRHAQKLEAVGRLAAGIAHEVNTPVQFVGDNLQFLDDAFDSLVVLLGKYRRSLSPDSEITTWAERQAYLQSAEVDGEAAFYEEEIPKAVAEAREGARRIATIVRAMKAFGHPDAAEQQATDLNEAVRNTVIVARNEYKYIADVDLDLAELPVVVCHRGDVNQALLNLIVNAAHAVGDVVGDVEGGDRGRITVGTALDGDGVVITVADTGTGIPEAIRHRIFEPFFTTKDVGRGTGQGLALVRAVADRHHGQVTFDTGPGGTTFFLHLPLGGTGTREAVV